MPSKSEINFCEMWTECGVGTDAPSRRVAAWVIPRRSLPGVGCGDWERAGLLHRDTLDEPWHITPRGADLVASYETAVSMGLEIVPDPGPGMRPPWDPAPVRLIQVGVACDCDDGFVGVPVQYSKAGGIVQVWPAKCPKCNVDRGQPGVDLVWEPMLEIAGSPIGGLGEILDDQRAAWIEGTGAALAVIDDGWRQLTRAEGERLAGKPFEARRDVDDPPRRHVAMAEQPLASAGILRLVGGGNMRFDGTWWVRDAVSPEAEADVSGWQPLTHELAATLEGKRIEARSSGDPHPCTACGLSPCTNWLRVDFTDGRYGRAGALGLRGGWYVRVIDEAWVTEPSAMMALLEEARLEGFEVEVKATERPGGKSSHRKLGSGGPVALVHKFSSVQAYVNFTWCAVAGYRGEYVGASPILTAVRRANGGRHGDA